MPTPILLPGCVPLSLDQQNCRRGQRLDAGLRDWEDAARGDRNTLLPIPEKCLLPGSKVITDDWGANEN